MCVLCIHNDVVAVLLVHTHTTNLTQIVSVVECGCGRGFAIRCVFLKRAEEAK